MKQRRAPRRPRHQDAHARSLPELVEHTGIAYRMRVAEAHDRWCRAVCRANRADLAYHYLVTGQARAADQRPRHVTSLSAEHLRTARRVIPNRCTRDEQEEEED